MDPKSVVGKGPDTTSMEPGFPAKLSRLVAESMARNDDKKKKKREAGAEKPAAEAKGDARRR